MSRIRADKFVNSGATGAPQLTFGAEVVAGVGLTGAGGINITGVATAASFSGAFSGDLSIDDKIIHTGDTNTAIRFPAADTFTVETAGTERVRVDSSGRLLSGTSTSPTAGNGQYSNIVIQGYAPSTPQGAGHISLQRGQAATAFGAGNQLGLINFGDNTGASFAGIECYSDAASAANDFPGRLVFSTTADGAATPTERLRIDSAGDVKINNGDLILGTAGKGISFINAADVATNETVSSSVLDDYEEGTWLPNIGGTATYDIQWGYYIKIGKSVQCWGGLRPNSMGTGNAKQIQNLPFTSVASPGTTMSGGGAIVWHDNCPSSITNTPSIANHPNTTYCNINAKTAASTTLGDNVNFWQNNHRANFFITYQTN